MDIQHTLIEIYCPLDICRYRNMIRGDKYETQSQEQYALMAENIQCIIQRRVEPIEIGATLQ